MTAAETATRLEQANAILDTYAPGCRLVTERGRVYFAWTDFRKKVCRLLWVPVRRGSDYPSISNRVPFGGTCTVATMELYRWVRGGRVRPLGMWRYFCSKPVGMTPKALEAATAAGWPVQVPCVFCGRLLGDGVGYDHYDRDGYPVGPGCWYSEGCSGKPGAVPCST
jgi:hypothetical protein